MLRPHTFTQLMPNSFTLMVRDGYFPVVARPINATETRMLSRALDVHQHRFKIVGFYIDFKAKTQREARAYFPNLSDTVTHYSLMCPVEALRKLFRKGCLSKRKFKKGFKVGAELTAYLKTLTCGLKFSQYALRIGGRTWYISQGMDRQFVDYLGTWASPEASARYYRENPVAVIRKVRDFYANLRHPGELY